MTVNQFDLSLPLWVSSPRSDGLVEIHETLNNRVVCRCAKRDAEQIVRSVNSFSDLLKVCQAAYRYADFSNCPEVAQMLKDTIQQTEAEL